MTKTTENQIPASVKDHVFFNEKGQAVPAPSVEIKPEDFAECPDTVIRWLGGGGAYINSRGTNIMIDPLLEGFDMPLLMEMPMDPKDVPDLDAVLVTHIDNDHFSRDTIHDMQENTRSWHAPVYVAEEMVKDNIPGTGHGIGDSFMIQDVKATLTPAWHNWQNEMTKPKYTFRHWNEDEYCGYWLDTPDGTIWMPGDSRLLDSQLQMPQPDVILFDFSDNSWHITLDGAVKLANTYPDARLILIHWGSVDAPDQTTFNGNPLDLAARIDNPERIVVLAPGEPWHLSKKQ